MNLARTLYKIVLSQCVALLRVNTLIYTRVRAYSQYLLNYLYWALHPSFKGTYQQDTTTTVNFTIYTQCIVVKCV